MFRLMRRLTRVTARLVLGAVLGTLGVLLSGLAPVLALAAVLVLLTRGLGR